MRLKSHLEASSRLDTSPNRFLAISTSESNQKQVLYIWGHTYQLGVDMSWEAFEDVCKKLSSVKGLVFETNKDALLKE